MPTPSLTVDSDEVLLSSNGASSCCNAAVIDMEDGEGICKKCGEWCAIIKDEDEQGS